MLSIKPRIQKRPLILPRAVELPYYTVLLILAVVAKTYALRVLLILRWS